MDIVRQKWEEILKKVKDEYNLSDVSFNTWLQPLSIYKIENSVVTIEAPSEKIGLEYISKKYTLPLKEAIFQVTGEDYEVVFISSEESVPEESDQSSSGYIPGLNPRYTFDTFVVGSNNRFAHAASLAVAESPGTVYNPLFLYGGVGLGKTHLMHSIAYFIKQNNPRMNILYVTSEQFTNEVIDAIRAGNANTSALSRLREKYRYVDVLLVDDIQFIIGKASTQEEFFHTFNTLHEAGKQIIISSDRPPKDMTLLEERFSSRFKWGLTADIQSPDYETRIAILQKKQENDSFYVKQEVIEYIAANIKSNIRELEGSLNKVIAFAHLEKKEADLELAKAALKDIIVPEEKKVISPNMIIDSIASYFNISADDIKGEKRNKKIAYPRQLSMYLIREMTNTKLEDIGEILGGRDHTTVMHGVKKIESSFSENSSIESDINNIKKMITG
jgi:chromosomal replication initiator protein